MTAPQPSDRSLEITDIVQRLALLRHRFRVGLPETLVALKKRVLEMGDASSAGFVNDLDLFFNVGVAFARRPRPMTMGEFSRSLNVPLSTATRVVDWLVSCGFASRLPDPGDRRIVRVTLTEAGAALHREIEGVFLQRIERLMARFTPQERIALLRLLGKIANTLEEESQATISSEE